MLGLEYQLTTPGSRRARPFTIMRRFEGFWAGTERYRSGHNGADSKSDGRVKPARGFESHPLRHQFPRLFRYLARSGGPLLANPLPNGVGSYWLQERRPAFPAFD